MNNIKNYKERFYSLMESTMGDVRPIISEQAVKFPLEMEVTSVNTELYNFLKANPKGYWWKKEGPTMDNIKGVIQIKLNSYTTDAKLDNVRFNIPGQENIGSNFQFPSLGSYTYANNKLSLNVSDPSAPLDPSKGKI